MRLQKGAQHHLQSRPKTFWFSTGLEPRRLSLYSHLADRIEAKYGYYCCRTGGSFRFYKLQQSS